MTQPNQTHPVCNFGSESESHGFSQETPNKTLSRQTISQDITDWFFSLWSEHCFSMQYFSLLFPTIPMHIPWDCSTAIHHINTAYKSTCPWLSLPHQLYTCTSLVSIVWQCNSQTLECCQECWYTFTHHKPVCPIGQLWKHKYPLSSSLQHNVQVSPNDVPKASYPSSICMHMCTYVHVSPQQEGRTVLANSSTS